MRHLNYVARRLVALLPVLFGITFIVFFMIHLVPGDPAGTLLGTRATDEAVAALHKAFGLDKPSGRSTWTSSGALCTGTSGGPSSTTPRQRAGRRPDTGHAVAARCGDASSRC